MVKLTLYSQSLVNDEYYSLQDAQWFGLFMNIDSKYVISIGKISIK